MLQKKSNTADYGCVLRLQTHDSETITSSAWVVQGLAGRRRGQHRSRYLHLPHTRSRSPPPTPPPLPGFFLWAPCSPSFPAPSTRHKLYSFTFSLSLLSFGFSCIFLCYTPITFTPLPSLLPSLFLNSASSSPSYTLP